MPIENAADYLLDRHLHEDRANNVALRYENGMVTYRDLVLSSSGLAAVFAEVTIRASDRVLLVLPDGPLFVSCLFGIWRIGALAIPVSINLAENDFVMIIKDCEPVAAIVFDDLIPTFEKIRSQLSGIRYLQASELNQVDVNCGHTSAVSCGWNAPALIQYTSGTTGHPKGVVHVHAALTRVVKGFPPRLNLSETDLCYSLAKMSFGYGFGNSILFPFAVGASSLLDASPPHPSRVFRLLRSHCPTILFAVPSLYAALLDFADQDAEAALAGVRHCISAGERLAQSISQKWKNRFGHELIDGLGATEALHIFLSATPGMIRSGSIGTPVAGCDVELRTEDGKLAPIGEAGVLHVRSNFNSTGYWRQGSVSRSSDDWIATNDLLRSEEDGFYYFIGRTDDLIKIAGLKVAPGEIEERLQEHESVGECRVVGAENGDGVMSLMAFVVLRKGWNPDKSHERCLREFSSATLAPHKRLRRIVFLAAMPKTTTGKIDRSALRNTAAALLNRQQ